MPWTREEIEQEWLRGGEVAASPEEIVEAFERLEGVFGRDWLETSPAILAGALR